MKCICIPMKAVPVKTRPPGNIFRFNCIVLAHPFRVRDYVKKITLNTCVHAVEVFNSGNQPEADVYGLAYARHFGYPLTAGSDMHYIPRKKEVYGVLFDEPWKDIFTYVRALREKKPFSVKTETGRGEGEFLPLERPYEFLDLQENSINWNAAEILN